MASFRTLLINSEAYLSTKNNNLLLRYKDKREIQIPFEDIDMLILENPAISISLRCHQKALEMSVPILLCDEKHLPVGLSYAFHSYSRFPEVAFLQQEWSETLKKQLHKQIITAKIQNQYKLLKLKRTDNSRLKELSRSVKSGDSGYAEGEASRIYFTSMFSKEFNRRYGFENINSLLNYGYAIVRAMMAKHLASIGFITSFGIFHKSGLNHFNLADDMIEPYRPLVDRLVVEILEQHNDATLTPETKKELLLLPYKKYKLKNADMSVANYIKTTAITLREITYSKKSTTRLLFPDIGDYDGKPI